MRYIIIFSFLILSIRASTQVSSDIIDLSFYADVMVNASNDDHRGFAANRFKELILEELADPASYQNEYKDLEWVSIQYPDDGSFRILSWQIKESENKFTYYNFLQKKDGAVIELIDDVDPDVDFEYETFGPSAWYGLLVYDIMEVKNHEDTFLVFGMHQEDENYKTKVVDVLKFTGDRVQLGANLFVTNPDAERIKYKKRLFLRYSANAAVNLNYNPSVNAIMYDHIISHLAGGVNQVLVPDGSYEAYSYENNEWVYVEKVYDLIMDAPPGTGKKKTSNKDVFGRKEMKKRKANKK